MVEKVFQIEVAIFRNGEFAAWQDGPRLPRRAAWDWLRGRGYKASDKGDSFLVSEVR